MLKCWTRSRNDNTKYTTCKKVAAPATGRQRKKVGATMAQARAIVKEAQPPKTRGLRKMNRKKLQKDKVEQNVRFAPGTKPPRGKAKRTDLGKKMAALARKKIASSAAIVRKAQAAARKRGTSVSDELTRQIRG